MRGSRLLVTPRGHPSFFLYFNKLLKVLKDELCAATLTPQLGLSFLQDAHSVLNYKANSVPCQLEASAALEKAGDLAALTCSLCRVENHPGLFPDKKKKKKTKREKKKECYIELLDR